MPHSTKTILASAVLLLIVAPTRAVAQNADELAKQTQNPVASLISVPLQGNWDCGLGERDATGTLLNIQPVMPFGISKSTNVILRVFMPLTSQPGSDDTRINGPARLLVANPINRYLLNTPMRSQWVKDADGGLTFYIQHESPGKAKEPNWLPAPKGPFYMVMRLYLPSPEAQDGTWKAPKPTKVG